MCFGKLEVDVAEKVSMEAWKVDISQALPRVREERQVEFSAF